MKINGNPVRLNVGCGKKFLPGYVNIDVQKIGSLEPDILADARSIPLPNDCADEVLAIHVFEHFYLWECPALLAEWKRLLKPGGLLALELPDIIQCAKNLLEGRPGRDHPDQLSMWGLYGDPGDLDPLMCHRWGWSPKTLHDYLEKHGFVQVREAETRYHAVGRHQRDMRMEARKP